MIRLSARFALIGLAAATLTGCVEDVAQVVPTTAEQACLAAVSRTTSNGDVALLGSEFSEAGTFVRVGVGEQRAPWKCIAYSDGTTGGIEYMGMNG